MTWEQLVWGGKGGVCSVGVRECIIFRVLFLAMNESVLTCPCAFAHAGLKCFYCPDRTPADFSRIPSVNMSLRFLPPGTWSSPHTQVHLSLCIVHMLDLRHSSEPLSYFASEGRTKGHHSLKFCVYQSALHLRVQCT